MKADDFVPITGIVVHCTSLGIFLEIAGRGVFIPANCTSTPSQSFRPGEAVTLLLVGRFAEREGPVE
jgi:hypothetical protein